MRMKLNCAKNTYMEVRFLDVGACMGSWTIPAILMGAKVIAIEPSKSFATLLKSNLAINGMEAEAQIMQIAAWNADGNLAFDGWFSGRGDDIIQARRIDGLDLPYIDFIKIDVEMSELQVLEGAQGLIKRDKPAVLVECHLPYTLRAVLDQGGEQVDGTDEGGHVLLTY